MKKFLLVLVLVLSSMAVSEVVAQQNSLGLRFGYPDIEVSYQRDLGTANRLELGLGLWEFGGFGISGAYQWVWDLPQLAPGFAWYAGAGLRLGYPQIIGLMGQAGIEYNFKFPITLSLDFRPEFNFLTAFNPSFGLGVRYRF